MRKRLYVRNLSRTAERRDLEQLFAPFGKVVTVEVKADAQGGQSRGLGLVEMETDEQGRAAIEGLNGQSYRGETLEVGWTTPGEQAAFSQDLVDQGGSRGPQPGDFGDRGGRGGRVMQPGE